MEKTQGRLTHATFDNPKWFSNEPPYWTIGRDNHLSASRDDADLERKKKAEWLWRHGSHLPEALDTGDQLWNCCPSQPCRSPACPSCGRAYTRWFVDAGTRFCRKFGGGIAVLSIVDASVAIPIGHLTPDVFRNAGATIANVLRRLGVAPSLITVDISANESEVGSFVRHWQPQGWVFAPLSVVQPNRHAIRAAFQATIAVPRPVKIQNWDGNPAALAYGLKNDFVRRVSYERPAGRDGRRYSCRNTRDRPLRVAQELELLLARHRAGFHTRLHLRGVRLTKTADGPHLRVIASNGRLANQ